jgi:hypothetical protein
MTSDVPVAGRKPKPRFKPRTSVFLLSLSTCYWIKRRFVAQEIANSICGLCALVDFSWGVLCPVGEIMTSHMTTKFLA